VTVRPLPQYISLTWISVLEYISREDADAAVKALDNKELRGNVVRVALGGEVGPFFRTAL
jgi:hypothetical protein